MANDNDQNESGGTAQERETAADGTYKNGNTQQGGNDPSGYPTPDSPVTLTEGNILDEPDDPNAARPEAPYIADEER